MQKNKILVMPHWTKRLLFAAILATGVFLLVYRLSDLMIFSGDLGWFYLSARDMVLGKGIPLVSITASHTWLHQGPFWTYMLAFALWAGHFSPLSGGYLAVSIGVLTIVMMYLIGRVMFNERVALIASALYATSPLALIHARMPYHITPIPLFTLLYFFSIYKFLDGNKRYFPLIFFFLAVLYNFELATVMLLAPLILIVGYGIWKKMSWLHKLTKRDISLALLAGIVPMIPVIIYDTTHGYKQTVVYAGWLVYNALRSLGLPFFPHPPVAQPVNIFPFTFMLLQRLVFLPNGIIALLILTAAVSVAGWSLYKQFEEKKIDLALILVFLWFATSVVIYLGNRTPSEAYVPVFFPVVCFLLAYLFGFLMRKQRIVGLSLVILLMGLNVASLLSHNYLMDTAGGYGPTLADREQVMKTILNRVNGDNYQLIGLGQGSQFRSFLMPYEYLGWYYGNPPAGDKGDIFIIEEKDTDILLLQKNKGGSPQ